MSELVRYFELTDEPQFEGLFDIITGKYRVLLLHNKGEDIKFSYEEVFTAPMLNYVYWIKDFDDSLIYNYLNVNGSIRIKSRIYYAYTEYAYTYHHSDGSDSYYLKVYFNSEEDMAAYVLSNPFSGTELTKEEYVAHLLSDVMNHPYIPPEPKEPVEEAPEDGQAYVRKDKQWVRLVDEETDAAEIIDHDDSEESGEPESDPEPEAK